MISWGYNIISIYKRYIFIISQIQSIISCTSRTKAALFIVIFQYMYLSIRTISYFIKCIIDIFGRKIIYKVIINIFKINIF